MRQMRSALPIAAAAAAPPPGPAPARHTRARHLRLAASQRRRSANPRCRHRSPFPSPPPSRRRPSAEWRRPCLRRGGGGKTRKGGRAARRGVRAGENAWVGMGKLHTGESFSIAVRFDGTSAAGAEARDMLRRDRPSDTGASLEAPSPPACAARASVALEGRHFRWLSSLTASASCCAWMGARMRARWGRPVARDGQGQGAASAQVRQRSRSSPRSVRVSVCVGVVCGGAYKKTCGVSARARRPLLTVLTSLTMDADTGLRPLKFHQPVSVSIT